MGSQLCCVDGIAGTFGSGWSLLLKVGSALAHLTAQAEELYELSRASAARGDSNTIHALMVWAVLPDPDDSPLPCGRTR